MEDIHLTIEPEDKKFLEEHPDLNASGILRQTLKRYKEAIE